MAACRSCGKYVSESAWTCPHCGSKTPTTGIILAKALQAGLVIFMILFFVRACAG